MRGYYLQNCTKINCAKINCAKINCTIINLTIYKNIYKKCVRNWFLPFLFISISS